ncbi:MAG: helix-turn-helix transcriptional regulator [Oscillospiraceae bacterium]|jgi:transcriptional regulator with XRE-family HTH domain|nr:helix-turn-helix transcriptional regulator [Oscillospiraceae bacterium]
MNKEFPQIISVLRRERGLSQKAVAQQLNISQALLSHYEKGIRECGLDFVVKVSDFYGVSCDYLLGKTSDRVGRVLTLEEPKDFGDIADLENSNGNTVLATLNKKFAVGSLYIISNILVKINDKRLTKYITSYFMTAIYKAFRVLAKTGGKADSKEFFTIADVVADGFSDGVMDILHAKALAEAESCFESDSGVIATRKALLEDYPEQASALINLIESTEKTLKEEIK